MQYLIEMASIVTKSMQTLCNRSHICSIESGFDEMIINPERIGEIQHRVVERNINYISETSLLGGNVLALDRAINL